MPASSQRWKSSLETGWPRRLLGRRGVLLEGWTRTRASAWRTMPCGAGWGARDLRTGGRAGEKARVRPAYREAVGYFEQALSTLAYLPEQRYTREQAIDLRLALRSALAPLGNFGRILTLLREAETLAAALDDPWRLGRVSRFL